MHREYRSPIIISVAPTAHAETRLPANSKNPTHPEEIAEEIINCFHAGACAAHLHVRDFQGNLTDDIAAYSLTIDLIRKHSDIIIQGSTGGLSTLTAEQRCTALCDNRTQSASLNMGSSNFADDVYINTMPDIRYWAQKMAETCTSPDLAIFTIGMISSAEKLAEEKIVSKPLHFSLCLGFPGALQAYAGHISYVTNLLPHGSTWGLIHANMQDFSLLSAALAFGAVSIRVGFEDSPWHAPGKAADNNLELVKRVSEMIHVLGFETAGTADAKKILGILK